MINDKISFAVDVESRDKVETTVPNIIKSRFLFEGDSGSGKSHGMTGMIEGTDGKAQRIIIDPEGEYFPLKDSFRFLLVGKKTDLVTPNLELDMDDIYVDKLIKKLIENSVDTIIDLSEFTDEAAHFFKIFKKAVFKYAKYMKRPLLIFVDEAQLFAPEKGQGNEESLKAMMELAKQGRKRGIGLICGTQAIADFSKNVVRQLRTRFIGNCTFDNDIKAAAHTLGFGKDRESELKDLGEKHHFFVSTNGGHITINGKKPKSILKIIFNKNKTKLYDFDFNSTKKFKEKDSKVIQDMLSGFSDINQEIKDELTEKEQLQKDNNEKSRLVQEQKIKILQLERQQPKQDPQATERAYQKGWKDAGIESKKKFDGKIIEIKQIFNNIIKNASEFPRTIDAIVSKDGMGITLSPTKLSGIIIPESKKSQLEDNAATGPTILPKSPKYTSPSITSPLTSAITNENIGKCEKSILETLAKFNKPCSRVKIGVFSGYSSKSGGFSNSISRLKSLGYLTAENGTLTLTDLGAAQVVFVKPLPSTNDEILSFWVNKVGKCPGAILEQLVPVYPNSLSREEVGSLTNYSSTSGGFSNAVSKLKTLGLIDASNGQLKASKEMFP